MSVLIVGGDKIDTLAQKLTDSGATRITHWTARKKNVTKRDIPKHIDIAVLFTDFINHSAARRIKTEVKKRGIPALFCKRSWSELQKFAKLFRGDFTGDSK